MSILKDIKSITSTRRDLRNFGLVVGIGFFVIGAIALMRGRQYGIYLAYLGILLLALGFARPRLLLWPQKAWMTFAVVIGFVMSRVILFIVFSIVIVPAGVLRKLAGKSFLETRFKSHARTYWQLRPKKTFSKEDWEKQF